MRDTMRAPSLQRLPERIHRRVVNGLAAFGDALWYRENMGVAGHGELFTVRIGDLLRAGMLWPDCEWLIAAGLAIPLHPNNGGAGPNGAASNVELTEYTLLELTDAGAAELYAGTLYPIGMNLPTNGGFAGAGPPPLFYCADRRELFLAGVSVLHLAANAENMEAILVAFQKQQWKKRSIVCPFADLANGKRTRAVRDAVFGLNHAQQPPRVLFHSKEKGARIWYALMGERPLNPAADWSPSRLPR